jgi:hypothetical protein
VQVGELENRSDDAAAAEFNAIYERWQHGELDLRLPGGETGHEVLDRYVPVLTDLRMRYLDDDDWNGDIVIVSHGAAIRLASAVLAGVDANFAVDHHLDNTEAVVLAPITDGRWSCVRWGALTPPFYPDPSEAGAGSVPTRCGPAPTRWAEQRSDRQGDRFDTSAADGVAVDDEHVRQQFWADAARLGAFRAVQWMANEGAVAVL